MPKSFCRLNRSCLPVVLRMSAFGSVPCSHQTIMRSSVLGASLKAPAAAAHEVELLSPAAAAAVEPCPWSSKLRCRKELKTRFTVHAIGEQRSLRRCWHLWLSLIASFHVPLNTRMLSTAYAGADKPGMVVQNESTWCLLDWLRAIGQGLAETSFSKLTTSGDIHKNMRLDVSLNCHPAMFAGLMLWATAPKTF